MSTGWESLEELYAERHISSYADYARFMDIQNDGHAVLLHV